MSHFTQSNHLKRLLCFGDSLTEGHTGGFCTVMKPYGDVLQSLMSADCVCGRVVVSGTSGEETSSMISRLESQLRKADRESQHFSLVVLLGGTNDVGRGKSAEETFENLKLMYDCVAAHGAKLCAVTLPENGVTEKDPVFQWLEPARSGVNNKIRHFVEAHRGSCFLFDLDKAIPHAYRGTGNEELWGDTLHLSAKGYNEFAQQLWACMKRELEIPNSV